MINIDDAVKANEQRRKAIPDSWFEDQGILWEKEP
jgi:hypothetical protein